MGFSVVRSPDVLQVPTLVSHDTGTCKWPSAEHFFRRLSLFIRYIDATGIGFHRLRFHVHTRKSKQNVTNASRTTDPPGDTTETVCSFRVKTNGKR